MLGFRDWLVLDLVRVEVYGGLAKEMALMEAACRTVAFVNKALDCDLDVFSEATYADPEVAKSEAIRKAAQRVRWAAMIEREELVAKIRAIFSQDYMPMLQDRAEEVRRMVAQDMENYKGEGESKAEKRAMTKVARDLEISVEELGRLMNPAPAPKSIKAESRAYLESDDDDWDMSDELRASLSSDESFDARFSRIVDETKPILVKLGYIDEDDLEYGSTQDKLGLLDPAIRNAAAETGNEVPENRMTSLLKRDKKYRDQSRSKFMEVFYDRFSDYADYQGNDQGTGSYWDTAQQRNRGGETTAPGQFLSDAIDAYLESLTRRDVNKQKGARDWGSASIMQGPSPSENETSWAKRLINTIKTRIKHEAPKREGRSKSLSTGAEQGSDAEGSSGRLVSLQAGKPEDDGTRGSIDPSDFRGRTSDREIMQDERRNKILDAFLHAMKKIRQEDGLLAMIMCVRFGLDCSPTGDMSSDANAARNDIMNNVLGRFASETEGEQGSAQASAKLQTPEGFLATIGVGSQVGQSEIANQKMVERLQELNAWDSLGSKRRGESPKVADGKPMTRRPIGDPEGAKKWDAFVRTVVDAMGEAFKKLARYMHEYLTSNSESIVSGRVQNSEVEAERWDLIRFLKGAFPKSSTKVEGNDRKVRVTFLRDDGGVKHVWDIDVVQVKSSKSFMPNKYLVMTQDGFPEDSHEMLIPPPIKCNRCGGENERCPSCMGWGYVLDIPKIVEMERELFNLLPRQKRKSRGPKE